MLVFYLLADCLELIACALTHVTTASVNVHYKKCTITPPLSPSPYSVLSWVGGASNIEEGEGEGKGEERGEGVEREGRDCKGNKLESLAVKFLEAWHYTHWLITIFTYHTSLSSLKLCTAYNTVPFLATVSRKVWMLT